MPPKKTNRVVSTSSEATLLANRSSRGRKQTTRPASEEADESEPDVAVESEDELADMGLADKRPTSRRTAKAANPAPEIAPKRRSARVSVAASAAREEEEVRPKPRSAKAVSSGRRKAKAVVSDEEDQASTATADEEEDWKTARVAQTETPSDYASAPTHQTGSSAASEVATGPSASEAFEASDQSDQEDEDEAADETIRLDAPPSIDSTPVPSTPLASTKTHQPPPTALPRTPFAPHPSQNGPTLLAPATPAPPAGPKPRLTIHKLVLVNFKSYAGRQEIGPFHKSFSAIVGPNGSGKSNTIDALLFVFGYRASKMRQGKLSELIHNSAGKEGLETCRVEVWFREIVDLPGVDNFLLVPNSQLVVTRTAYRNNSSKYTINERTSTFTEVTTMLKGKGIDLDHNRFLILQGEVESIALMKPKAQTEHEDGLLEYLEDIIGTTKYKQPIEDANTEVERLNEERGEKMNRLRVVERERASLEDKKVEAEEFLRDSNELTRKKSLLWQYHMHILNNNLEITTKAIELAEEQERNGHHVAEIDELQKAYDEKLATFEEVNKFADQLLKDSKKFEKEEVGLLEKKKHLGSRVKKVKKSIADDGHTRSEATATIENCDSELERNRAKVADLEKKLEIEEEELEEIRDSLKALTEADKTDHFTTQINVKQRELEPWTAKIAEKQSAFDVATSERDLLVAKATGAQNALSEAKANLEKIRETDGSKQEEYANLKKEHSKLQKVVVQKEQECEAMTQHMEKLRAKVASSRSRTDDAKASLAADKSENAVLSSLNKLKAQGRIKGFHGRLGDLGVIDDKYDVAVTTACSALNNLVVDTVEQGQACIEHLRKGNVGRASFMVLEKLPPRDLTPIETPENVPRLFDLIKPKDPRFAPAFYKGVFNTLVADDLTQAQPIGYGKKRWRVVTLAGQLIDPSGTMSGGGSKVSRGGMSSKFAADKVAPEVVANYEMELVSAEQELAEFMAQRKVLEGEVQSLRKRIPEVEIGLEKVELDVRTGEQRIAEAKKRLTELEAQSKPDATDEKRIKSLSADIATLSRDIEKLRSQSSSISSEIKDLQNKILEVGGVKLRAIQSKVATTKGLLDLANESITKSEVNQVKAQRDAEKASKAIEKNTAALEEVEAELATVQEDLDAVQADLGVIRAKVQEARDACVDVQEGLEESKQELDEKSADINAFRKLEMDIKQKVEDNQRIQKDSRDKMKHWRKRHDELELAYVDEDDEEEEIEKPETPAAVVAELTDAAQTGETEDGDTLVQKPMKKKRKNEPAELVEYSPDELRAVDKEMLNAEITQLEEDIGKAKPNLTVLTEYRKRDAEFLDRAKDLESVTSDRDGAKKRYDDLRKVRLDEFMAGFSAISAKLKEMYQMITMGGNAEIELIDSMDPFSEGVVLSIMPPKKSWRAIANLSGGEKTLASLALVFALHVFKPTPLYFMDEIDAALDFKNVSIVANYIQSKTQAAQFIVISLRNDMFELAHRLVGIYKTSNCTKSIAIDNKDLHTQAIPRGHRLLKSPSKAQMRSPEKGRHIVQAGVPAAPMSGKDSVPATPMTVTA